MNEFTLSSLMGIFKKCILYMIIAAILFAIGAYCYCEFIAIPTYQTKISFLSTNSGFASDATVSDAESTGNNKINNVDLSASRNLVDTYVDIFKTRQLYVQLKERTGLDYTPERLKGMVSISCRSESSLFIDIKVTCENPEHAILIADTLFEIGDDYIVSWLPTGYVMAIEDSANKVTQNYPRPMFTVAVATVVGAALVFVIAVVITVMDKTIKGEQDFSANYDIPILGNIPNFRSAAKEEKK